MGILAAAKPAVVVCTRDRDRATMFYRDILGLTLVYEDTFAAVFSVAGITLPETVSVARAGAPGAGRVCDLAAAGPLKGNTERPRTRANETILKT